jgi:hypothetical protein
LGEGGGRGRGRGGVYSGSYTCAPPFLTTWGHLLDLKPTQSSTRCRAMPALTSQPTRPASQEEEKKGIIQNRTRSGRDYAESYTREARFRQRWDNTLSRKASLKSACERDPHPCLPMPACHALATVTVMPQDSECQLPLPLNLGSCWGRQSGCPEQASYGVPVRSAIQSAGVPR